MDAGILIALQRTGYLRVLKDITALFTALVVEEVYDELVEPRNGRHQNRSEEARRELEHVEVVSIVPGTQRAETLDALRARKSSVRADLGECASIAWALHDDDSVFVTRDRAAAYLALEELHGRARSFFSFLRSAAETGAIDRACAKAIGDLAQQPGVGETPPVWWDAWTAVNDPAPSGP